MGNDETSHLAAYTLSDYTTQSHSQTQNQLQCDHFLYCEKHWKEMNT